MVNFAHILSAFNRLDGHSIRTPLLESEAINQHFGGRVLFKTEALQRTGSFKFRGAFNKLSKLAQEGVNGVVAYSSGNHAQGVALTARQLNMQAVIIMPEDAPAIKINNTKQLGAEVILYDRYTQAREEIGDQLAASRNLTLVKPYDDEDIIAGQGTVGLEIVQQLNILGLVPDQLIAPCGGGGLISGTAIAMHQTFPDCHIYCAEPDNFDDTARSLATGSHQSNDPNARSICDAIVTPTPGKLTFPIMQKHLQGGLIAKEQDVMQAMTMCMQNLKTVIEPGGCVGLGALLDGQLDTADKTTVVVLSGGNADTEMLQRALGSDAAC